MADAIPDEVKKALDRFDEAAQQWGWESDQGHIDSDIQESVEEYTSSKADLIRAIELAIRNAAG